MTTMNDRKRFRDLPLTMQALVLLIYGAFISGFAAMIIAFVGGSLWALKHILFCGV